MSSADYDWSKYSLQKLPSTLSAGDYARFQTLNSQFRNAFGGSFGDFDYNAFVNDATYRDNILKFSGQTGSDDQARVNAANKQAALQGLIDFFEQQSGGAQDFRKIDFSGRFDPLRQGTDQLAAQSRRQVTGDVNRAAASATDRASESLAGLGLGRSGVAAKTFTDIESQRASKTASALEQIETARVQQQYQLDVQEANLGIEQDLAEQGYDVDTIRNAQQYQQTLMALQFQAVQGMEMEGGWLDTFGDIIDIGVGVASFL